jgi:hypothetical protein
MSIKSKVLLYQDKIFLNARSFHEYILENIFDGNEPHNWSLGYVAVAFSNKLNTIQGFQVEWITIELEDYDQLQNSKKGWLKWTKGKDKSFSEFVISRNEDYTKEKLWRWAIDYVTTYDLPRSKMKKLVDEILIESKNIGKKKGVLLYSLSEPSETSQI